MPKSTAKKWGSLAARRRRLGALGLVAVTWLGLTVAGSMRAEAGSEYGDSDLGGMSADGRYVLFDSTAANLVPGSLDRYSDVFLRDRASGTTTQISRTA